MLCITILYSVSFAFIITESTQLKRLNLLHHISSVNDSLVNFLPAFQLEASELPWPEGLSEDLDDFLDENPLLSEAFSFASLKIIRFSLKI